MGASYISGPDSRNILFNIVINILGGKLFIFGEANRAGNGPSSDSRGGGRIKTRANLGKCGK
jgi:hypothetical protein